MKISGLGKQFGTCAIVWALAFPVLLTSLAQAVDETMSASPGGASNAQMPPSNFWDINFDPQYAATSPITATGNTNFDSLRAGAQSFQNLYVGGFRLDGGYQTLRSAEILKAVCSGSKYAGCAKPDEAAKGIDAAALAYGVPSVALICIGVEDAKSHDVNYQGQDSGGKQKLEFSRSMEKANEPGFKKADQFFKSVVSPGSEKGGSGGNQTPVNSAALRAKNDAEDFRKMLIMMEKPLTEKLQNNLGPNQNWENIVKLLAARTYMGIEGAAQLAASGSLDGDKVFNFNYPPSLDKFINAVIECTRKAGATKGAKPGQGNRPGN